MTRAVFLLIALALAGCSTRPPLAEATGPWRAMNTSRWEPSADDLRNAGTPRSVGPARSPAPAPQPAMTPASAPQPPAFDTRGERE